MTSTTSTTSTEQQPARPDRFRGELVTPFVMLVGIAGTSIDWAYAHVVYPPVALPLFVLTAAAAVGTLFPWTRLTGRRQVAAMSVAMVLSAAMLPFVHAVVTATIFPYVLAATAGRKLASRTAAVGVAVAGAVVAAVSTWVVGALSADPTVWTWWLALTVGFPVYVGISRRDRAEALHSAQQAVHEARRASESEAREATLIERGRIAREIHDVLGHSLSGIALQLDMADALRESGRDAEATAAVRTARELAVDSIAETRRAVHALREDTLVLADSLHRLAEHDGVALTITGEVGHVGAETRHTVLRTAQEALTNAAKHAPGATRALHLACTADRLTLTVHNGPPTADAHPELATGNGLGLVGLRERAALIGGTLHAAPNRDGGWTVELELPR